MTIYFKRNYKDLDLLCKHRDEQHDALVGSPAYINNEIAIIEEDGNSFTLCIGKPNNKNLTIELDIIE